MKNVTQSIRLFLMFLLFAGIQAHAQKPATNDWNLRIGAKPTYLNKDHLRMDGFVGIDVTRNISQIWETGIGYAVARPIVLKMNEQGNYVIDTIFSHRFDAIANFHFLPLMMHNSPERFDVYVATRIGVRYLFTDFKKKADFFAGLGAAWYFTDNIGAFGEFGWQPLFKDNVKGYDKKNWRLGVALKF